MCSALLFNGRLACDASFFVGSYQLSVLGWRRRGEDDEEGEGGGMMRRREDEV